MALLAHLDVVEDLRHVRLADHFVAREDQGHLEVGHTLLDLVDDALDHGELVEQGHVLLLLHEIGAIRLVLALIVQAAGSVPQFDDKDILLDARLDVGPEQPLEEGSILGQSGDAGELVLEEVPDVVRLEPYLLLSRQQDLASQHLVILFRVAVEGAHLLALDVAILHVGALLEYFEEALPLVIVSDRVIGQLNEDIYMRRCSGMHMVQTAFWHLVQ